VAGPRIINNIWLNWYDTLGGQCQTGWSTGDQTPEPLGPYAALASTAQALSVAGNFNATMQKRVELLRDPSTGVYGTVRDQVLFDVASANYTRQICIPAPIDSIFLPDSKYVDMSNPLVVSFLAQVFSVLGDSYGAPWTVCRSAWRRKVRIGGE